MFISKIINIMRVGMYLKGTKSNSKAGVSFKINVRGGHFILEYF